MKNMSPLLKTTSLLLSAMLSAGLAHAAENDPGIGNTTRVDKISVSQASAASIEVVSKGADYDTVTNKKFSIQYNAEVKCRGLWDVHYFGISMGHSTNWISVSGKASQNKMVGNYYTELVDYGKDSGEKTISVKGKSLGGPMHPEIRKAAINQCNSAAAKVAEQENISLAEAMSKDRYVKLSSNWVDSQLSLNAWASCGKPQVYNTWYSVYDGAPDINVHCKARPYVKSIDTSKLPANQLSNKLEVKAALKSDTTHFSGKCAKEIVLTGEITANKASVVEYQWKSGNGKSMAKKVTFNKAGKRQVTHKLNIGKSTQNTYTLVVKGPVKTQSNPVNVSINCTKVQGINTLSNSPKTPGLIPQ